MKKFLLWVTDELQEMVIPTLFFLVSFNLLVLTVAVLSNTDDGNSISHTSASIGALIVGKAFLLADHLPTMKRFAGRPLVYSVLWSALIYFLMAFTLHLGERLISVASYDGGILVAVTEAFGAMDWANFGVVQLWVAVLLVIFAVGRAAISAVGRNRAFDIFFAKPEAPDQH